MELPSSRTAAESRYLTPIAGAGPAAHAPPINEENRGSVQFTIGYKLSDGKAVPVRRTKGGFRTKKEAMKYIHSLLKKVRTVLHQNQVLKVM